MRAVLDGRVDARPGGQGRRGDGSCCGGGGVFLLLLLAIAQATGLRSQLNVQFLQERLQANPWSGLALFVTLFCLGNMAQVPVVMVGVAAVPLAVRAAPAVRAAAEVVLLFKTRAV